MMAVKLRVSCVYIKGLLFFKRSKGKTIESDPIRSSTDAGRCKISTKFGLCVSEKLKMTEPRHQHNQKDKYHRIQVIFFSWCLKLLMRNILGREERKETKEKVFVFCFKNETNSYIDAVYVKRKENLRYFSIQKNKETPFRLVLLRWCLGELYNL